MPTTLDPRIPLQAQFEPVDFGAALQRSAQLRQFATQEDAARQQIDLQRQQANDLHQGRVDQQTQTQQANQSVQEATAAYQAIKGGNADEVLRTLNPQARVIAESWLKEFSAGSESRLATIRAHAKTDAQTIRDLNYDPVVAGTIMQLRGDEYPEFRQIWESVKDDPAALKRTVDHYATLGDKPQEPVKLGPGDVLVPPTGGAPLATNPKPETPPAPFTLGPGQSRFDGSGKPITSVAPKAEPDDVPLTLTPEALALTAKQYAMTGQLPPMGMGKNGAAVRTQIINRAAEIYKDLDLPSQVAAYQANKASLVRLTPQLDALTAFEATAGKNLERFIAEAKKMRDTGSPLLNQPLRAIESRLLGSAQNAAFNTARSVVLPEFARIITNPNLTGALSVSARAEIENLIKGDATLPQVLAAADVLVNDAKNRRTNLQEQIRDIAGRIASPPGGAEPVTVTLPGGRAYTFPNQNAADQFKRAAGVP